MLLPAFRFHSLLLIFVNLWPISTLCVADMVHAVADMVCGRYRRFPLTLGMDLCQPHQCRCGSLGQDSHTDTMH